MKLKMLLKSDAKYPKILEHFRKQYNDVAELTELHAKDKQIFGGEWIDSKGNLHITTGTIVPDCKIYIIHDVEKVSEEVTLEERQMLLNK